MARSRNEEDRFLGWQERWANAMPWMAAPRRITVRFEFEDFLEGVAEVFAVVLTPIGGRPNSRR